MIKMAMESPSYRPTMTTATRRRRMNARLFVCGLFIEARTQSSNRLTIAVSALWLN